MTNSTPVPPHQTQLTQQPRPVTWSDGLCELPAAVSSLGAVSDLLAGIVEGLKNGSGMGRFGLVWFRLV